MAGRSLSLLRGINIFFLNRYRKNKTNLIRTRVISHTDKDIAGD